MEPSSIPDARATASHLPPELTVGGLVTELRSEVARQQCWLLLPERSAANPGECAMTSSAPMDRPPPARRDGRRPFVDSVQITANLKWAQQQAARIGLVLPELKRFGGIKRRILRFLARCIFFAARALISQQRDFNQATLTSLTDLANGLRVVEQGQRTVVNHLEHDVAVRLRELEQTVERLKAELQCTSRGVAA
jgi:hypothetical protein